MTWNETKPALANQIAADVPDIWENFDELRNIIEAICGGTVGTTASSAFYVDKISGTVTNSTQCAFSVKPAGDQSNIAVGAVTVVFGTEIFDQANNFSGNRLTFPVTGKYQLNFLCQLNQLDTATTIESISIQTSNRSYLAYIDPDTEFASDSGDISRMIAVLADADANDICTCTVAQTLGAEQVDIKEANTYFTGFLAC